MVHFVGAGPGALDLITVRGQRLLQTADVVIYAGSLVNKELLQWTKEGARLYDSALMTLEQVTEVMAEAEREGLVTVRLHTGDPCIYGAVREQMDWLEENGIFYDICPGVSSFCGAAASLGMEYTLPGVSQSVIITRMQGRTPVPEKESIASLAAHGATMVVFLSAGMLEGLSAELIKGGFRKDTPAAIVYKATWPEEKVVRCTVGTLAECAEREGISKTALIVAGDSVSQTDYERSRLYDPVFSTGFRKAQEGCAGAAGGSGGRSLPAPSEAEALGAREPSQAALQSTVSVQPSQAQARGTMYVVGMGPGSLEQMTGQARQAIERCSVVAGYTVYVELLRRHFPDKTYLATPMTKETERCRMALECCMEGKNTAMVCSGDSGVYGMAGLILELSGNYPGVEVRVIPGVTAASAGAALLGAPLMHDFAVISLSDRLTPLETIWNRVEQAARADFVICLYNPASKGRPDYFRQACLRIGAYRPMDTICGLASNIGREGERVEISTLGEIAGRQVDMFTTVFIGNSSTKRIGGAMVTPRGYKHGRG